MLKKNLFFLFSFTLFAVASLVLAIYNYNPFESDTVAFVNFYLSCFFAFTGVLAIFIYFIKYRLFKGERMFSSFWPSIRQGGFIAAAITALLLLQGLRLLDLWIGTSLAVVMVLLELFFQSKKPSSKTDSIKK